MLLSRLAEPCMLLAVLYVVVEAGIPVVATATLHNLAVAVMIAAPEIILPGAFVISKQAKEHGQEYRPLLVICWLFVLLTLITLVSLFVLHLDKETISIIMCFRCAAGVGYSILVRMLSYKGLSINQEPLQTHIEQPAPFVITPELLETLRGLLAQTQTTVTEEQTIQALPAPKRKQNNYKRVKGYMQNHPEAKVSDVAKALHISNPTASKWMSQVQEEREQKAS